MLSEQHCQKHVHDLTFLNTDEYDEYLTYFKNQIGSMNAQEQLNVLLTIFGSNSVLCTATVRPKV